MTEEDLKRLDRDFQELGVSEPEEPIDQAHELRLTVRRAGVAPRRKVALGQHDDNDAGRADAFVESHLMTVRFVPEWDAWLTWKGHRWQRDEENEIWSLAIEHYRDLQARIIKEIHCPKERGAALARTLKMGNANPIRNMLTLAKADRRIVVSKDRLDTNRDLLGLKNGVWDFRENAHRPGRREDLITLQVNCEYDPLAAAPLWKSHIEFAAGGDANFAEFLKRIAGYSFTGHTKETVWFFHYGSGQNGKSVYCSSLLHLAGDYGHKAQQRLYMQDRHGKSPEDEQAALQGKRFVVGPEVEEGERLAEGRLKELVDDAPRIVGRWQHDRRFEFDLQAKLWLYGNHQPQIMGTDRGTWRRLRLVPWVRGIAEENKDLEFKEKILRAEMPGVLNWVLEGAASWQRESSLSVPSCVIAAGTAYREQEDVLADFFEGETVMLPEGWVAKNALYQSYCRWAEATNIRPLTLTRFNKRVRVVDGVSEGKRNELRGWRGIELKDE